MEYRSPSASPAGWLWVLGRWAIDSGWLRTIEAGNGWNQKKRTMTAPEKPSLKQGGGSSSSNRGYLSHLLGIPASIPASDARQTVFVYVVGMALLVLGGVYALWRISLLSEYLAANRAYVLERNARWEKHIQGQAEVTREILRRLPER